MFNKQHSRRCLGRIWKPGEYLLFAQVYRMKPSSVLSTLSPNWPGGNRGIPSHFTATVQCFMQAWRDCDTSRLRLLPAINFFVLPLRILSFCSACRSCLYRFLAISALSLCSCPKKRENKLENRQLPFQQPLPAPTSAPSLLMIAHDKTRH